MTSEEVPASKRSVQISLLVVGSGPELEPAVRSGLEGLPFHSTHLPELPPLRGREDAWNDIDSKDPDLALVDEDPGEDFAERLRILKARRPRCQILLLSRENSDLSPRKLGSVAVRHWFFRPVNPEDLSRVLQAAGRSLRRQWQEEHRRTRSLSGFDALIGEHAELLQPLELAKRVAQSSQTSVLILGETGTGKGLLAQAIHAASPRRDGPYVEINCGAIPENLLESELFGHVRGAFTGAERDKPGLLELADGGTAFLDEIGELSQALQAKLLKFLDDGKLRRVQGTEQIRVDARVIAATNRDLEHEVSLGRFRLDLFHRLNVVSIQLPPLRARSDDIPLLARHYVRALSRRLRGREMEWTPEALESLKQYAWPGNVRELVNVTERLVLLLDGNRSIEASDLPQGLIPRRPVFAVAGREEPPLVALPAGGISLREVERAFVQAALARTSGNVSEAARLLRMSRGSLRYRLVKLGLKNLACRRRGRPRTRRAA